MRNSFMSGALKEISLRRSRISPAFLNLSRRSRGLIWTRMVSHASLSRMRGVMVGLLAKRIETGRVEVIRREYPRQHIHREVGRRSVEGPATHHALQGRALQGTEG